MMSHCSLSHALKRSVAESCDCLTIPGYADGSQKARLGSPKHPIVKMPTTEKSPKYFRFWLVRLDEQIRQLYPLAVDTLCAASVEFTTSHLRSQLYRSFLSA